MAEYKYPMELIVHFNGDLQFIADNKCDKYLLKMYLVKGIQEAFEMVGSGCGAFTELVLRSDEQTLARRNEKGEWVLNG